MSEGPHDDDDVGLRIFSAREVRKRPFVFRTLLFWWKTAVKQAFNVSFNSKLMGVES